MTQIILTAQVYYFFVCSNNHRLFFIIAYLILEVNSKAGLEGIETFTGLNIAKHFAEYVVETLRLEKAMEKAKD